MTCMRRITDVEWLLIAECRGDSGHLPGTCETRPNLQRQLGMIRQLKFARRKSGFGLGGWRG